jgi:hypothetical protein
VRFRSPRRAMALALMLGLFLVPGPPAARGQSPAPGPGAAETGDGVWPRQIEANGAVVLIYQPQIDKWEQNRLEARAAVSVRAAGAAQTSFGVIWISARTEVDKAHGIVSLEDINVSRVSFPGSPQKAADYLRFARQHVPAGVRTVPLEQLEANLAIASSEKKTVGLPVKNDPPRIIVSATPAVLVRIDGQPTLRQLQGSTLLRVINTRALILLDPATGGYYLHANGGWMTAAAVEGPWMPAVNVPPSLDAAQRAAVAAAPVDLLDEAAPGSSPTVYVSTVPAELIETIGAPAWTPIPGTELLAATNTKAHLFLELRTQYTYVLISGRWFRTRTMDGPWEYVPGAQLPAGFAKIPERDPSGVVLASVPGTPQAQEAVIANTIPQTATVSRSQARFTATYDGPPQWRPIEATPLVYAVNSPTPVIRVDPRTYYALYNGIWFVAVGPAGPWAVAASVPAVVYAIPVTSPLHYVTYVRVYGATPTVVYVGYTPGYLGTVVTPDGVVVYGTGVVYTPWVGTVWYPPPPTYGYGAGFAWGATTGFMMGAATSAAVWGCCGSSSTVNVNVNKTTTTYNGSNVYNSWSKTTVSSGDKSATAYRGPNSAAVTNNQNNNVYASHDGNVYKKEDGSWQKWDGSGSGWQPVQTSSSSTSSSSPSSAPKTQSPAPGQSSPSSASAQKAGAGASGAGRQSSSPSAAQTPGTARAPGAEGQSQRFGSRSAGAGGGQGFGSRFSGGGWQGLEGESMARARGAERFGGRGGGFFRR